MCKAKTRVFSARYESLAAIDEFVAEAAESAGFDDGAIYQVRLAVDEACSNIIEHAYGGEGSDVIECSRCVKNGELTVVLKDHGEPFDPESVPEPNIGAGLEERTGGGLGLFFIYQIMDEVDFDFGSQDANVLTLVKRKESSD
jgi:anti-sigma regulatory factor (Ser/Thr protein kinase)